MNAPRAPLHAVLPQLATVLLPAAALLPLTYFLPAAVDLSGPLAVAAYWVAQSGGTVGTPLIGVGLLAVIVARPGLTGRQRIVEAVVIVLALGALLGGGAYLNEHVVKPHFAVPRPNIVELAATPADAPTLGLSAEKFYELPDKATRGEHLDKVLTPQHRLHDRVRQHWVEETGYSFPSGHSFSSMLFATFFVALGLTAFAGRRRWAFALLVVWALAVCFSRPILRVHSPADVVVGGLEGMVAGVVAYLLARAALAVLDPD